MISPTPRIYASSFIFLKALTKNNNRDWFLKNKGKYQDELLKMEAFADALLDRMKHHDRIDTESGKKAMMRIYRDIRFSTDKTPYSTRWAGGFHRQGKYLRGGYYFHFEPGGKSLIAGGFWGPVASDLKLIRGEFAFDDKPMRKVLNMKQIKSEFKNLAGDTLKTIPRGYSKDDPAADLLRYKQFILQRKFSDEEVLSENFLEKAVSTMRALRPFFDYMSEILYLPE